MKGRSSNKMKVFEPFKINQMELKNRMVGPMSRFSTS